MTAARGCGRSGSARPATCPWGPEAWEAALKDVGISAGQVDRVAVTGMHGRAVKALARKLGSRRRGARRRPTGTVGQTGAAHPGLVLASLLEQSRPGEVVALVDPGRRGRRAGVPDHRGAVRLVIPPSRSPTRSPPGPTSPTGSSCRGGAWSLRSLPGGPSPSGSPRRPRGGARTGSSASSGPRTGRPRRCTCRPSRMSMKGGAVDDMDPIGPGRCRGDDRHVHHRPVGLLAESADRVRRPRLRRWRPVPGRADRCRPRDRRHRRPGGHDVPQAVHRRRHPRLFLEGQAGPSLRRPASGTPASGTPASGAPASGSGPLSAAPPAGSDDVRSRGER